MYYNNNKTYSLQAYNFKVILCGFLLTIEIQSSYMIWNSIMNIL